MNIYVVVEGEIGEKYIYQRWIPYVNPTLSYVRNMFDIRDNDFSIISGMGYPQYLDVIQSAIEDVNAHGNIDRFVVAVDAEEMSYEEKYAEIHSHLARLDCRAEKIIIIQNFCLETWGLGNRKLIRRNPESEQLIEYKNIFDVTENDPEELPGYKGFSRVRFAEVYLRTALLERNRSVTYRKGKPDALFPRTYFEQVRSRFEQTGHIKSFEGFLNAFSPEGMRI